jgi:hypothetical protein
MKIYTLTIAYNEKTEEVEYLQEEVMIEQEDIVRTMDYTTVEVDLEEWVTSLTDESIEVLKEIAEA